MYGKYAVYDWSEAEIPANMVITRFAVAKQSAKLAKYVRLRLVRGGLSFKQATQLADTLNFELGRLADSK